MRNLILLVITALTITSCQKPDDDNVVSDSSGSLFNTYWIGEDFDESFLIRSNGYIEIVETEFNPDGSKEWCEGGRGNLNSSEFITLIKMTSKEIKYLVDYGNGEDDVWTISLTPTGKAYVDGAVYEKGVSHVCDNIDWYSLSDW